MIPGYEKLLADLKEAVREAVEESKREDVAKLGDALLRMAEVLEGVLEELRRIGRTLDEHTEALRSQSALLREHSKVLEEHTAILREHSKQLQEHTKILQEHSKILEEHARQLGEHTNLLQRLSAAVEEQGRILQEHSKILEEHTRILEHHSRILEEHSKQLQEHTKILQEHTRILQEHTRLLQRLDAAVGSLGGRVGIDLERTILNVYRDTLSSLGVEPLKVEKLTYRDLDGRYYRRGARLEIDVCVHDERVYFIEVKSLVELGDVEWFEERCGIFERILGRRPDRKVVVALNIFEDALQRASELGMTVVYGRVLKSEE